MTTSKRFSVVFAPLLVLGAVLVAGPLAASRQGEPSPAGDGARFPSLARAEDGRIAMVWTERGADSVPTVRLSIRGARGQWSAPATVVRDSGLFVNFADIPRVAWIARDELAVSWLQRSGSGRYDYGIRVARTKDGGRSWTRNAPPHDSTEAGEHGFMTLVPLANARLGLVFLNGHAHGAPGGGTQVAYTEFDTNGAVAKQLTLDGRACDCCQTAATATSRGLVVTYRDRSQDEIRDIAVTRQVGNGWSQPELVSRDRWKISGCPVNGPAIASNGQRVVVAWFSAARDTAKVQVAFSDDAGVTFGAPIRIDGGTPAGHVDITMQVNGSAIVSWLERMEGNTLAVRLRRVSPDRRTSTPATLGEVHGIRPTGWPAIVPHDGGVMAAWTVPGNPTRIRLQHISSTVLR